MLYMNIAKCNNGHFFDKDKYNECPHCKEEINAIGKESSISKERDLPETVAYYQEKKITEKKSEDIMKKNTADISDGNDVSKENKIVVGWLVGISGYAYGRAYHLYVDETTVKGCVIGFNTETQQFYLNFNSSKGYIYVNQAEVVESIYLNYMDVIIIEGFEYMLVPLCKDGFSWWENNSSKSQGNDNISSLNNNDILSIDDVMRGL